MKNSRTCSLPSPSRLTQAAQALSAAGEVLLAELGGVVALRPEVVVDDVEHHAQPEAVRLVHEPPEVVRRAVAVRRGEQVHAVVAPAPAPGEVGQGHQLDRRHPQVPERLQPLRDPLEGPLGAEGADVQLVDDQLFRREALPGPVGPAKLARVHHLRRPVDPLGLDSGSPGRGTAPGRRSRSDTDPRPVPRPRTRRSARPAPSGGPCVRGSRPARVTTTSTLRALGAQTRKWTPPSPGQAPREGLHARDVGSL